MRACINIVRLSPMTQSPKSPRIAITVGPVTKQAQSKLVEQKSLAVADVPAVSQQCSQLMSEVTGIYSSDVAAGEVGPKGSARAGSGSPDCPVGLLYGRVQSGKTNAMILSAAMAIDNGFRVIVVLTSDVVDLVDQTRQRFEKTLAGPLVFSSAVDQKQRWQTDRRHAETHAPSIGVVIVCAKNRKHIGDLIDFLHDIGATNLPALIMDDEADQATPDTKLRKRANAGAGNVAIPPSRIHGLAFGNDPQVTSLRSELRHNFFLQVTATPQALLLQPGDASLKPDLKFLLQPGRGYLGGDYYFDRNKIPNADVPLVYVDPSETTRLARGDVPDGLKKAVLYYLLASARMADSGVAEETSMLLHTSSAVSAHSSLLATLNTFLAEADQRIHDLHWQAGYDELRRSCQHLTSLARLRAIALARLPSRRISSVNYRTGRINYGPAANFIIGGNILGRGLTIRNLIVTYYLRTANVAQMDTMHQHARMYGYRGRDRVYLRVFLTRHLAQRFNVIHESEEAVRKLIADGQTDPIPVMLGRQLRATRPSVLDPAALGVFYGGQQVYPILPYHNAPALAKTTDTIQAKLIAVLGLPLQQNTYVAITYELVKELIRLVPISPNEPGSWQTEAMIATLDSYAGERGAGEPLLYVRLGLERKGPELETGALSGAQQAEARRRGVPVLFLFLESGDRARQWSGQPFWYPTLSFPQNMRPRVYSNPT